MFIIFGIIIVVISIYFQKQVWTQNRVKKNSKKSNRKNEKNEELIKKITELETKMQSIGSGLGGGDLVDSSSLSQLMEVKKKLLGRNNKRKRH